MSLSRFFSFYRCQDGNVAMMTALLIMPLIIAAGGALDFMHHEQSRASLQNDPRSRGGSRGRLPHANNNSEEDNRRLPRVRGTLQCINPNDGGSTI